MPAAASFRGSTADFGMTTHHWRPFTFGGLMVWIHDRFTQANPPEHTDRRYP
jgi:hypothetical protein